MAKKKNQTKKHKFKHTESQGAVVEAGPALSAGRLAPGELHSHQNRPVTVSAVAGARNFSYVGHDLRRILIFAGALILLELSLWALFTYTGLGDAVYRVVRV